QVFLAGDDTEAGAGPIYGASGRDLLAGDEISIEKTASICVFDTVQSGVRGKRDAGREVNTADEADGSRRKRRLGVAEESGRTRERDCKFVGVNDRTEAAGGRGRCASLAI